MFIYIEMYIWVSIYTCTNIIYTYLDDVAGPALDVRDDDREERVDGRGQLVDSLLFRAKG